MAIAFEGAAAIARPMPVSSLVPRALRRPLRHLYNKLSYAASVARGGDPLMPPGGLHSVGDSDFRRTGDEFLTHFIDLAALQPGDRVLDIGCGTGRMARPLTAYLTDGSYDGVDIVSESIAWCRRAYRHHPNFRFHHTDIYNKAYNPSGIAAADYRFPFPDSSFDFIFLTSVFTHMLTRDVEHYLDEIARVLAPGGRVLITAFLLDERTRALIEAGSARFTFAHPLEGCRVEDRDIPENAVAYDGEAFRTMIENRGLSVDSVHPGAWRGASGLSFQDMVIASRPAG